MKTSNPELSLRVLLKLPDEDGGDYVESLAILPIGSTVYIQDELPDGNTRRRGPYEVCTISTDVRVFKNWTSETVWIQLRRSA